MKPTNVTPLRIPGALRERREARLLAQLSADSGSLQDERKTRLRDERKTKPQLLAEVRELRRRLAEAREGRLEGSPEQQEYYRDVALYSADLLIEFGAHGRILYVSPTCVDLLGRPPEDLAGRSVVDPAVLESVHPEDRIRIFEDFPRLLSCEEPGVAVFRFVHRDGRDRRLEAKANTFRTPDGELRVVVGFRDLTTSDRSPPLGEGAAACPA